MPLETDATFESSSRQQFSRRQAFVLLLQSTVIGGLSLRMCDLQVMDSEGYQKQARKNRITERLTPPRRGEILDRHGTPIATLRPSLSIFLARQRTRNPEKVLAHFAQIANLSRAEHDRILAYIKENPNLRLIPLLENANWETVARLSVNAPGLPSIDTEQRWVRSYPYGKTFAHAVGYVGQIAPSEIKADPSLTAIPELQVGKRGTERRFDFRLRGQPGFQQIEVNASGQIIRKLYQKPPKTGTNVRLTLDVSLQKYAQKRLGTRIGAALVMDVRNGEVLCLFSNPGFDPNLFASGITEKSWNDLRNHADTPLIDRVTTGEYAPGSIFKIVVALAALKAGFRHPNETIFCSGRTRFQNREFHCWNQSGHGSIDLRSAIQQSCDTYFYHVADELGIERITAMANQLGIGIAHDLGISQPRSGFIPSKTWLRAHEGRGWLRGDSFNTGIGQGFVLTTPLQLALMTARIANGASALVPHLVLSPKKAPSRFPPLGIDSKLLAIIRDAMFAVCNEHLGTAYRARIMETKFAMAGKTSTSQVRSIQNTEREAGLPKEDQVPFEKRDHSMFVGYAPAHRPRFATSIVIEHGGSGSQAAAPVARDLLLHVLTNGAKPIRTEEAA